MGLAFDTGVAKTAEAAAVGGGDAEMADITTIGEGRGCRGGGNGGVGSGRSPEIGSASHAKVASPVKRPSGLAIEANEGVAGTSSLPKSGAVDIVINGAKCTLGAEAAG